MAQKFDGDIGRMVRRHSQYARGGRTTRAKRLQLTVMLEMSTNAVMTGCRRGLDQMPGLAQDPATTMLLEESVVWMVQGASPVMPLTALTQRVSKQYRAQIPAGDDLGRKRKKALKKELHTGLLSYADTLVRLERDNGLGDLGRSLK